MKKVIFLLLLTTLMNANNVFVGFGHTNEKRFITWNSTSDQIDALSYGGIDGEKLISKFASKCINDNSWSTAILTSTEKIDSSTMVFKFKFKWWAVSKDMNVIVTKKKNMECDQRKNL